MDSVLNDLKPLCAICGKYVDNIESEYDFSTMNHFITVQCHGQKQTMKLSKYFTMDHKIEKGIAFNNKVISYEKQANI